MLLMELAPWDTLWHSTIEHESSSLGVAGEWESVLSLISCLEIIIEIKFFIKWREYYREQLTTNMDIKDMGVPPKVVVVIVWQL